MGRWALRVPTRFRVRRSKFAWVNAGSCTMLVGGALRRSENAPDRRLERAFSGTQISCLPPGILGATPFTLVVRYRPRLG